MKVFILGMHRSGTSMITGILYYCGLKLGKPLLMRAKDNPKGHFENKRFLALNQQLLIKNGGRWYDPPIERLEYHGLKKPMKDFLAKFPVDDISGFKDPRACFTFPLWRQLIDPDEKVKVIYVMRPTVEIAKSLKARNNFSPAQSLKLSMKYINMAACYIADEDHMVVKYHDFFSDKVWKAVGKMAEFIGLNRWESKGEPLANFIDKSLWHHREANG